MLSINQATLDHKMNGRYNGLMQQTARAKASIVAKLSVCRPEKIEMSFNLSTYQEHMKHGMCVHCYSQQGWLQAGRTTVEALACG